jgi:hypothetical protein
MKLCVKVVIATQQRHAAAWASALTAGARPNMVLLKFMTSKDHQVVLRRHKGLMRTSHPCNKHANRSYGHCSRRPRRRVNGLFSGEARLLTCNRSLCQRHSNLPALLYLGAQGPERPMRGIMEHTQVV